MPHFHIVCVSCRKKLKAPADAVGKRVRCPRCGHGFVAQSPDSDDDPPSVGLEIVGEPLPAPLTGVDNLIGRTLGTYKLVKRLGRGGRGVVYEAEDTLLGRPAAVKVLLPEVMSERADAMQRFVLEARAASKLDHPNCLGIYNIDKQDGLVFISMPLVRGVSAMDMVKSKGPLDPAEATRICRLAAKGLAAAHAVNLVHRDVKPDNIMVAENGEVKVADFGMVKMTDNAVAALTEPGKWLGTPYFMSPEQCRGEPVDGRSDVYALGATYYCLLCGEPPFWGLPHMKVIYKQVTDDPLPPQQINPRIPLICVRVIEKAMSKIPADRYKTAEKMAAALENIEQSLGQTVKGRSITGESSSEEIDVLVEAGRSPGAERAPVPRPPAAENEDSADQSGGYGLSLPGSAVGARRTPQHAGFDPGLPVEITVRIIFASAAEAKGAWRLVRREVRDGHAPEFTETIDGGRKVGRLQISFEKAPTEVRRVVQTLQYGGGELTDVKSSDRNVVRWLAEKAAGMRLE